MRASALGRVDPPITNSCFEGTLDLPHAPLRRAARSARTRRFGRSPRRARARAYHRSSRDGVCLALQFGGEMRGGGGGGWSSIRGLDGRGVVSGKWRMRVALEMENRRGMRSRACGGRVLELAGTRAPRARRTISFLHRECVPQGNARTASAMLEPTRFNRFPCANTSAPLCRPW